MDPETLSHAVEYTEDLFIRFLAGINESSRAEQAEGLPNHAVWLLGHCALTMHRVAAVLDEGPLPESDFLSGSIPEEDPERYVTEMVRKDSVPSGDATLYPSLARGEDIFRAGIARLASAVRASTSKSLSEPMTWHGTPLTRGELVLRVCFHNGCHAGQLVDLRRAMSLPNVIPT